MRSVGPEGDCAARGELQRPARPRGLVAQPSSGSLAEEPAVVLEALEVTSLEWRLPSTVGVAVLEKQVQLSSSS